MTMTKQFMTRMTRKIADSKSERILTFKNRFTGEIVYSSNLYNPKIIDGAEFILVFPKLVSSDFRRTNWMKRDNLEFVPDLT